MKPEITVVMSVYNGEQYLRESVESILLQEYVDFEFIIINDGSTDESGDILSEYNVRDKRIQIIEQENTGLTRALIRGCNEARGKYIARQDVGDLSHPQRLLLQKTALDNDSSISFVSCWTEFCGPELEFLFMGKGTGKAVHPIFIVSENEKKGVIDGPSSHPSVMFRNNAYKKAGGYRGQFYYAQDWDLWYRLAEIGKFYMINYPLYKTRVMPNSISGRHKKQQDINANLSLEAFNARRQGFSEEEILIEASKIRPERRQNDINPAPWLYFIGECLRRNADRKAIFYLKKSIKDNPFFWKSWIRLIQAKLSLYKAENL